MFNFRTWLRAFRTLSLSKLRFQPRGVHWKRVRRMPKPSWSRLTLSSLEDRTVPTAISWIGTTSQDWSLATNWSTGVVPTSADDVTIGAGATVLSPTSPIAVNSISLGGSLELQTGLTINAASTISGSLVAIAASSIQGGGSLTIDPTGNVTNNTPGAVLTIANNSVTNNGALIATGNAAKIFFNVPTLTNFVATTLTGGAWEAASGGIIDGLTAGITTLGAGTHLTLQGASSNFFTTSADATNALVNLSTIDSTATFTVSGGASFNATSGSFANNGTISVGSASTLQIYSGTSAGTWNVSGGLTFTGPNTFNAGTSFIGAGTTAFNSGTQTFNANVAISTSVNNRATLSPSAGYTLTLSGATLNLSSGSPGTLSGAGTTDIASPATIALSMTISGNVSFSNSFTVSSNAQILLNSPGVLTIPQGGVLNLASNSDPAITGGGQVINSGLIEATVGRASDGLAGFSVNNYSNNATGEFRSAASGVNLSIPATGTNYGLFSAVSGATLGIGGGTMTLNAGTSFAGPGTIQINGGTYNVTDNITGTNLDFTTGAGLNIPAGKTWTLTGNNTVAGMTLGYSSSAYSGTLLNTGTLAVNGNMALNYGTIDNAGTINIHNGGVIGSNTSTTLLNESGAEIHIQSADNNNPAIGSGTGTFSNLGSLIRDANSGKAIINEPYSGDGPIQVETGILEFQRGATFTGSISVSTGATIDFANSLVYNFNTGTTVTGPGTIQFDNGTFNFNDNLTMGNVQILGSSAYLSPATGKTFTITGTGNTWSAGTIQGAGIVANSGTLAITNGVSIAGDLTNNGTINWSNGNISGSGSLINFGVIADKANSSPVFSPAFDNRSTGAYIHTGTGTTDFNQSSYTNSGQVDIRSGILTLDASGNMTQAGSFAGAGELQLGRGNYTFTAASEIGVDHVTFFNAGTSIINGAYNVATSTTGSANGNTVTFSSTANVISVGASFTMSGGTFTFNSGEDVSFGNLTLGNGTLQGSDDFTVATSLNWDGGTIAGSGTLSIPSGVSASANGSATLTLNNRTLALATTLSYTNTSNLSIQGAASLHILNGGTYSIQSDAGISNFSAVPLSIDVGGRFEKLLGTGTSSISAPVDNQGAVSVASGTLTFYNPISQLSGTTLTGGNWEVGSGTLNLPGTGIATIGSSATVALTSATSSFPRLSSLIAIQGALTLSGGANLTTPASTVTNTGTTTISTGSTLTTSSGYGFQVSGGTLQLDGGAISSTASVSANAGGTIAGTGTIDANLVMADGILSPGASPGIITINGNLSMNSSTQTKIEIAGTNASTPDFDQINVNGTVALDGTLDVRLINGFTPAELNTFQFITNDNTDGITGAFAGLAEGATLSVGATTFQITYAGGTGNDAVLTAYEQQTYTVTDTGDAGPGTLRQAITDANSHIGGDIIAFNIAGSGPYTITPTSALPIITSAVTIDGFSQPGSSANTLAVGSNAVMEIVLSGAAAGAGADGLDFENATGASTVSGLVLNGWASYAIKIYSSAVTVSGDFIGTDVAGASVISGGSGILVGGPNATTVGGADPADRNIISLGSLGIGIQGDLGNSLVVENNYIGLDATGKNSLGNTIGIYLSDSTNDQILENVVGGATKQGILLSTSASATILGNMIGADVTGTQSVPNANGIVIYSGSTALIGDNTVAGRNVISGNAGDGIVIDSGTASVIKGNYIGVDVTGNTALPNTGSGIDGSGQFYGGAQNLAIDNNVISGNKMNGISLDGAAYPSMNNVLTRNYIGVGADGKSRLGNTINGIVIEGGSNNVIDGSTVFGPNVISGNIQYGIEIERGATNNVVKGNLIGVDSTGTVGVPNSIGITVASSSTDNIIGGTTATERNIISGNSAGVSLSNSNDNLIKGNYIGTDLTGTMAIPNNDGILLYSSTGIMIGGTLTGEGNLISGNTESGIYESNSGSDATIQGNIIGLNASGNSAIGNRDGIDVGFGHAFVGGTSPAARNVVSGNTWDGLSISSDGSTVQGNYFGTDLTGTVAIGNGYAGVDIENASSNIVGGTSAGAGNLISGNAGPGIQVYKNGTSGLGNTVEGNVIGTDVNGTNALPNHFNGIEIDDSANNMIGGTNPGTANLISGNIGQGIDVAASTGTIIDGNSIGTDSTLNAALANSAQGINLRLSSSGTLIGDGTAAGRNIISGNTGRGIYIDPTSSSSVVQGNYIGVNVSGDAALGNGLDGVRIDGFNNTIGGTGSGDGNVISGNSVRGVIITTSSAANNMVLGNAIGSDLTGQLSVPNHSGGILISNFAVGNIVGGTLAGSRNIISGNTGEDGVTIREGASGTLVEGNLIGVASDGATLLANGTGISIESAATDNIIGGSTATARNVISGNTTDGIDISDSSTSGNLIHGNYIGTDASGKSALGNLGNGISISDAPNNTIGGAAGAGNVISGNDTYGVIIQGANASGNMVQGNLIGTDASGTAPIGNAIGASFQDAPNNTLRSNVIAGSNSATGYGVYISGPAVGSLIAGNWIGTNANSDTGLGNNDGGITIVGTDHVLVGGITAADRNIISGNTGYGVYVTDDGATDETIQGNYIGTDVTGKLALGNTSGGVSLMNGVQDSSIANNLISGNQGDGVTIDPLPPTQSGFNTVTGNLIGLDVSGQLIIGNSGNGVNIIDANDNTIGGVLAADRNIISGNSGSGVAIQGSDATGNIVEGNYIGIDSTGARDLGNTGNGVEIFDASTGNIVGGDAIGAGNVISGNDASGVSIRSDDNSILGNFIGTTANGLAALGNVAAGVYVSGSNNLIGGPESGVSNLITSNAGYGVDIDGTSATGNVVRGNSLFGNGLAGLALTNGAVAGVPVQITELSINTSSISTSISGSLTSVPNGTFVVDFFSNDSGSEGQHYLGSALIATDNTGVASFNSSWPVASSPGQVFAATATQYDATNSVTGNTGPFATLSGTTPLVHNPPGVAVSGPLTGLIGVASTFTSVVTDTNPDTPQLTYTWTVNGPGTSSINGTGFTLPSETVTNQPTLTFTPSEIGDYEIQVTVTDGISVVVSNTTTLVVKPIVSPVVISGMPSGSVDAGSTLNLGGSLVGTGSTASEYAWSVLKDGQPVTVENANSSTFSFSPVENGIYTITLAITDSEQAVYVGSVLFSAINGAPDAKILGAPLQAYEGIPIRLSAGGNNNGLAGPLTYTWDVNGSVVGNSSSFTFVPSSSSVYNVQLTVSDGQGRESTATTTISVATVAPTATIVAPATASVGSPITLVGSGEPAASGDADLHYDWTVTQSDGTQLLGSGPNFTYSPTVAGTDSVALAVYTLKTDGSKNPAAIAGTTIAVTASADQLQLTVPSGIVAGTSSTFLATVQLLPAPFDHEQYQFTWTFTGPTGAWTTDSPGDTTSSVSFTPLASGDYTVSVRAHSADHLQFTASAAFVVAKPALVASIGGVPNTSIAGSPITLFDPNIGPDSAGQLTYNWSATKDGASFASSSTHSPTFTFTPDAAGSYQVSLSVSDGQSTSPPAITPAIVVTPPLVNLSSTGASLIVEAGSFTAGSLGMLSALVQNPPSGVDYTFSWSITGVDPGETQETDVSSSSNLMFTPTRAGQYQAVVTATGGGAVLTGHVDFQVLPVLPVVSITTLAPQSGMGPIIQGMPVQFIPDLSENDAATGPLHFNWEITGPGAFTQNSSNISLQIVPPQPGDYLASLQVTNDYGDMVFAAAGIHVVATQPKVTILSDAGTSYTATTFTQNFVASVDDPGSNGQYSYQWYLNGVLQSQATEQTFSLSGNVADLASFSVMVTVTDNYANDGSATTTLQLATTDTVLSAPAPQANPVQTLVVAQAPGITIDASNMPPDVTVVEVALGGNTTLIGGQGPSVLQGDSGYNSLLGGTGPNTLIATQHDTLVGGQGPSNVFLINPGAGIVATAGPTNNTLSFAPSNTGVNLDLSQTNTQVIDGSGNSLSLSGSFQTLIGGSGDDRLTGGTATGVMLFGGSGNDSLASSGGSSVTLVGGTGNDTLSSGSDNVLLLAGPGNQLLMQSGGSSITMFGGTGDDSLASSGGSSITLVAGTGSDTLASTADTSVLLQGGSTNATLMASGGSSITMFGGTGDDSLASSGGSSITLVAGTGSDTLATTADTSVLLQGGSTNATLTASGGSSITMFGGTGDDSLASSGGSSITLVAGTGNDTLASTGDTSVLLQGGSTNATLTASGGSSITMFGGTGDDSLASSGGSSITLVAGTGSDTLASTGDTSVLLQGGSTNATLTASGGSSITMFGGTGDDSLASSGGSSITLVAGTGSDTLASTGDTSVLLQGGSTNATLTASGGSSITMFGGTGDDSLASSGGSSITLVAGTGSDTLASTGDTNVLLLGGAGAGSATLSASGGSSITMFGGTGDDSLASSGGSSITLVAGTGSDTLASTGDTSVLLLGGDGAGNATLSASGGSSITMFGGTGDDSLASSGGSSITLVAGTGNDTLASTGDTNVVLQGGDGTGNATLTASGGSSITMFGGTGNDSLASSGGSSITLVAGTGSDTLASTGDTSVLLLGGDGAGNATLTASGGSSITMFGGTGNDSLASSGGSSITLVAGTGSDTLSSTGDTNVVLQGGATSATLTASGGSSITMFGGTGDDSLASSGGSSITMVGGTGNDSLGATAGTGVVMAGGGGNTLITATGGSSITMFGGTGNDTLSASGSPSVTVVGGTGNDTLSGVLMVGGTGSAQVLTQTGGSSITMFGGTGDDSLASSGGSSITLIAGTGNDTLSSTGDTGAALAGGDGTGNATLTASGGSSITMFGGTGDDSLASSGGSSITLVAGTGSDTVSSTGDTSVYMTGGDSTATLTASGGSSITMFGGTGDDSLASSGGSSITLVGGSGNDTIGATDGSTVMLLGGTGDSTLMASGGSSITMFGGTGDDSLASTGGSSITMVGGSGSDSLASSGGTNVSMEGGSGDSTLMASGGSSITMFGGTGNDSLASSGGSSITMVGGVGNDTLLSNDGTGIVMGGGDGTSTLSQTGGSSITMFGGTGDDSLASSGGSSVTLVGGSGNDSLSSTGGTSVTLMNGGTGNDTLASTGGSSITMFGGAANDTLSATGGTAVGMYGLQGDNTFLVIGDAGDPIDVAVNDLATYGQTLNQTDGQSTGINTLAFPSATGIQLDLSNASTGAEVKASQVQQVAPGIAMSLTGVFQQVVGTPGNDSIVSGAGEATLLGGDGNDTLIGGSGDTTLVGGSGDDSLMAGTGNTTFQFDSAASGGDIVGATGSTGTNTLDFSAFDQAVHMNLGSSDPQAIAPRLSLTLQAPGAINAFLTSPFDDVITGNSAGDAFHLGSGSYSITGGGGRDAYFFNGGSASQNITIDEPTTGNSLNFLGFGSGIDLSLASGDSGRVQALTAEANGPTLTLGNTAAFSAVVGTPYTDSITGDQSPNAQNATIIGGGGQDHLVAGDGDDFVQGYVTQVVYLHFPTVDQTLPGDHVYTPAEMAAIQQGLEYDYRAFSYYFTQDLATAEQVSQLTGGHFATVLFDGPVVGGASDQLDIGNRYLQGTAKVNVSAFLGSPDKGLVVATTENIIGLSTTIAAHELGHMSGLQHQDAFGPIGSGIYGALGSKFYPEATDGGAPETPMDIMASPDSVGTTLLDAAGATFFGERDLIKLAFNDTGNVQQEQSLPVALDTNGLPKTIDGFPVRELGDLPSLAVPNTLPVGAADYGKQFEVAATAINANLSSNTEEDFYSFNGKAGQVMSFQVISNTNTFNTHPILPELVVVGPDGSTLAYNVHEFESADSTILDLVLPADGQYSVGVDSIYSLTSGDYQLVMYSFATSDSSTGGGDNLVGGPGQDTLVGSSGNDQFTVNSANTTVIGGSGHFEIHSPTTLSVAASAQSVLLGEPLTLTAVLSVTDGGTPTGSIEFIDAVTGQSLGTAPLQAIDGLLEAQLTRSDLAPAAYAIQAKYAGDTRYLPSASSTSSVEVVQQIAPTLSVSDTGGTYSADPFAATATVNGGSTLENVGVTLDYQLLDNQGNSLQDLGSQAPVHSGSYSVTASFAGSTHYTPLSVTAAFAITPAPLTYQIGNATQTYGTAADLAVGLGTSIATGVNGETLAIAYASVGDTSASHVGSYSITGVASDGTGALSDYAVTLLDGSLNVTPVPLTYQIGNATQTYGTAEDLVADLGTSIATGVNGETLAIAYSSTGDTAASHVGSYSITGVASDGTGALSDYAVTLLDGSLNVTPAPLTYQIGNAAQTYGTAADLAGALGTSVATGVNGETLAIAYASTGDTSASHVGSYSITGVASDGTGVLSDYAVTLLDGSLNVTPAPLTYQIGNATQTYGTAADLVADLGTSVATGVNGETLAIAYSSTGDTSVSHVGSYSITGVASDGTGALSDYAVTLLDGSLNVTPAPLTYQIGNATQTYGTAADLAGTLGTSIATGVNGETLAIAYSSTGDTAASHVGSYSITGVASDGTGALSDYAVTLLDGSLNVTPAPLTYQIGNATQTYGTVADLAADLGTSIATGVNGETLAIAYSSTGDTAASHVGSYSITGVASDGTGALSDYAVTLLDGSLNVTPAPLTYQINNATQTYGTATDLAGTLGTSVATGVNGETLAIAYASVGDTSASHVGSYSITGVASDGTGALSDYAVTLLDGSLNVTPAPLTVTITADDKTYDGTTAAVAHGTLSGVLNGDSVSFTGGSATFASEHPGTWPVTDSGIGLAGADAGNYTVNAVATATATIHQAASVITWPDPAAIAFGTALSGTQLNATANVAGTFVYSPSAGTVLAAGPQTLTTTFTPSDQVDYASATMSVPITVTAPMLGSIYVLNPTASGALRVSGNGEIDVPGQIFVDSNSRSAIIASGNASIMGSSVEEVGGYRESRHATISPAPSQLSGPVADPFAGLPVPANADASCSVFVGWNCSRTIDPGVYDSIWVSGNGSLTMNPGVYIIKGGGFSISGNGSVSGSGVMIYNAGSRFPASGGCFGNITLRGNGAINLTPMTSGPYANLLFFQARDNDQTLILSGNGIVAPGGTIYAPAATVAIRRNGSFTGAIVADELHLSGNSDFNTTSMGDSGTAYAPDEVRSAYGVNSQTLDGTGQTIAIVDAYDNPLIYESVDAFDTAFSTSSGGATLFDAYGAASEFLTVLGQDGSTLLPGIDPTGAGVSNWEMEEALDVQWAHAMAPGARIVLVEANSPTLPDLMSAVHMAAGLPGVSVVSMSWGFEEGMSVVAEDEAHYDSFLTTPAGHIGVTFVASTGDYGAETPQYPAYSPNVVAIGGTSLYLNSDSSYGSEIGWGYASSEMGTFIGGGGGLSQFEVEPAFQSGVQSTGHRSAPDVSFMADPGTGAWIADVYNLSEDAPWARVGGTSLSAPAWAALFALANQGRVEAGKPTFGANGSTESASALYNLPASDYHAVTSGSNGYSAGAGYNLVSGLGTPIANVMLGDLVAYNGSPMGTATAGQQMIAASGLVLDTTVFGDSWSPDDSTANANANGFASFHAQFIGSSAAAASSSFPASPPSPVAQASPQDDALASGAAASASASASTVPSGAPATTAPAGANLQLPAGFETVAWVSGPVNGTASSNAQTHPGALAPSASGALDDDVLIGGDGNDILQGDEGHELLIGGFGRDGEVQDPVEMFDLGMNLDAVEVG